ncbi:MAG: M3 family oligoendopeptidase [Bacteroidota bacterium]|nr:M3 family oligoendopeptidase [Bacteroidota bacterium]
MKFSEMKYLRPDIEEFKKNFEISLNVFINSKSYEEAKQEMDTIINLKKEFDTMSTLCYLKFYIDTKDEKFMLEQEFFDSHGPVVTNIYLNFYKAILQSKFKENITKKYGRQIINIAETEVKSVSSGIVEDKQKENLLCSEYTKLISSAIIRFDGKEMNSGGLFPYFVSKDRGIRKKSNEAYWDFHSGISETLDKIFDELVKLRNNMALKLGYKNFVGLGYHLLYRTDYDSKMVKKFGDNILKYFLPLSNKLKERKRIRLGLDKILYYDQIQFKSGNAEPKGDPESIVENSQKMYNELSEDTKYFFKFMTDNNLLDLYNRINKLSGGFCSYIELYKSPFIFANMNGTANDVMVLTHEVGHAFQKYMSNNFYFPEYTHPNTETAEIHSMSMEFFTYPWMELFFKEDTDKFKFSHIEGFVSRLSFGVMVDSFQHWVYENPNIEPPERNLKWKELKKKYLPTLDFDGLSFLENGNLWKDIFHIFHYPFYFIDYNLASMCALQFWSKAIKNDKGNFKEAWNDYVNLCRLGGSKSFLELLKEANLESPFDEEVIRKLANEVDEYLESIDDSKFN